MKWCQRSGSDPRAAEEMDLTVLDKGGLQALPPRALLSRATPAFLRKCVQKIKCEVKICRKNTPKYNQTNNILRLWHSLTSSGTDKPLVVIINEKNLVFLFLNVNIQGSDPCFTWTYFKRSFSGTNYSHMIGIAWHFKMPDGNNKFNQPSCPGQLKYQISLALANIRSTQCGKPACFMLIKGSD